MNTLKNKKLCREPQYRKIYLKLKSILLTIFSPYPCKAIIRPSCQKCTFTLPAKRLFIYCNCLTQRAQRKFEVEQICTGFTVFISLTATYQKEVRRINNIAQSRSISGAATEDTAAVTDNLSMRRGGQGFPGSTWRAPWALTFQSSDVTSLLLGTSCPPSRMQCRSTSCVEPLVLFSLRFQIRAVESPDLQNTRGDGNPAAYPWAIPVISCIC